MAVNFLYPDNISVTFCQGCSFTCRNHRKHNESAVCHKKKGLYPSERPLFIATSERRTTAETQRQTTFCLAQPQSAFICLTAFWDLRLLFCTQTNWRCKHEYSEVNWCEECSSVSSPCTESFTALCWGATKD